MHPKKGQTKETTNIYCKRCGETWTWEHYLYAWGRTGKKGVCPKCSEVRLSEFYEVAEYPLLGVFGREVGQEVRCIHCEAVFVLQPFHWEPFKRSDPEGCFECRSCGAGEGDLFPTAEGDDLDAA